MRVGRRCGMGDGEEKEKDEGRGGRFERRAGERTDGLAAHLRATSSRARPAAAVVISRGHQRRPPRASIARLLSQPAGRPPRRRRPDRPSTSDRPPALTPLARPL